MQGIGADLARSLGSVDARDRPNFYDSTVQRYADMPIHRLTIHELLSTGSQITDERLVSMAQVTSDCPLPYLYFARVTSLE